ncbi:alpha/beta hydrolase [Niabella drilacis]|uniref:Enterochelin esterase n=1 Tax=Niabella drilacis (strain DSM 25811 / CCM 8410 / CCUG 62505 / LMG 26954 / E90) TaxID=1285928 RepID=A0A1G7AVB0_NIADE|nr:alpha/beta hydrolase-fold protein [Niabella drilacis]SDE18798.1 Enterochelin esterase [Niabella drilacis]
MNTVEERRCLTERATVLSTHLKRGVTADFYLPAGVEEVSGLGLLLINDGQDLPVMGLQQMLTDLYTRGEIAPVLCVGITAGADRKREYGVAAEADYLGRGDRAENYSRFIIEELIPYVLDKYKTTGFRDLAFAGFSLGGLSALDIVWNHPQWFSKAGVFSGSLWWRSRDQDDAAYDDDRDRIMQQQIRKGHYRPGLKFFLQCGLMDEAHDRNNNGVIDAVDDTRDIVKELMKKGYQPEDVSYLELDDGKHDVATWAKAMPVFLKWGWGR